MPKQHNKYAGAAFRSQASASKINRFVNQLPDEDGQATQQQVTEELTSSGLMAPSGDFTQEHANNLYVGN